MKRFGSILFLAGLLWAGQAKAGATISPVFSEPGVWTSDLEGARGYAQSENQFFLINFGRTLGCSYCFELQASVYDKPGFTAWATSNRVALVYADYDAGSNDPLVQEIRQRYPTAFYFPTIIVVSPYDGVTAKGQFHAVRGRTYNGQKLTPLNPASFASVVMSYSDDWNDPYDNVTTNAWTVRFAQDWPIFPEGGRTLSRTDLQDWFAFTNVVAGQRYELGVFSYDDEFDEAAVLPTYLLYTNQATAMAKQAWKTLSFSEGEASDTFVSPVSGTLYMCATIADPVTNRLVEEENSHSMYKLRHRVCGVPGPELDAGDLVWTSGGDAAWYGQWRESHDGDAAACSGPLEDGQTSWLQTTVTGSGTLSFWWRVSSEYDFDKLSFSADGVEQTNSSGTVEGWVQQSVVLTAGQHTLRWVYSKDGSLADGEDCGWLDQVTWTPTGFAVVFDACGGTVSPDTKPVTPGAAYGALPVPSRAGYSFMGWWLTLNGMAGLEAANTRVPVATNHTLMAKWERNEAALYLVVDLSGGPGSASYPFSYLSAIPAGGWSDEYKTTRLVLRKIPAGVFTMGSPADELGRVENETRHEVTLTKDFYAGVFEVTQRQWELVMGYHNHTNYFENVLYYASRPAEQVSYDMIRGSVAGAGWPVSSAVDATSFMGRLRAKTGLSAFDLPTEAQWEYACRAGTATALNSGKNLTAEDRCDNLDVAARYGYNSGALLPDGSFDGVAPDAGTNQGTAKVGSYLSNAWGLYDMHGNVTEWCLDYSSDYTTGAVSDPVGAEGGLPRVLRGGGWMFFAKYSCAAHRNFNGSSFQYLETGFRVFQTLTTSALDPVIVTVNALPEGVVESAYSVSFEVAGGMAPYTWSLVSGSLPAGLTLTTSGELRGTPTAVGSSSFTVRVTDRTARSATRPFTLAVYGSPGQRYLVIDLSGGTRASSYPISYLSDVPAGGWADAYKTTKLVLRRIPAGSFTMGSPATELGRDPKDDETQHGVTLTKACYAGVFEVTQRQWELVMGTKPSYFNNATVYATRPVEGGTLALSVTASDAADPDAARGMLAVSWFVDGALRQVTKSGAPAAITSVFAYKPGAETVSGTVSRVVTVKAIAQDRQGASSERAWRVCVTNTPVAQKMTFKTLPVKVTGDADFDPGATAASLLPVVFSSGNSAVAEIANNRVRIVGAGSAVITALQQGSVDFLPATATQTLTVKARLTTNVQGGGGSVSGAGAYVPGTRVTLTARPQNGYAFRRWEDGSQSPTRTFVMPTGDMAVTAEFMLTQNVSRPTIGTVSDQDATVGMFYSLTFEIQSDTLPTVTVSGLPSGLKYDATTRSLTGVPTASGSKAVTVTVKNASGQTSGITFWMTVESLPAWAQGTFNGWHMDSILGAGQISASVSALGKISGKIMVWGTNHTFSAASYFRTNAYPEAFCVRAEVKTGKSVLVLNCRINRLAGTPQFLSVAEGDVMIGEAGCQNVVLYRNVWTDADMRSVATNYTGYYTAALPNLPSADASDDVAGSGYLTFTVDKTGGVKSAGKLADGTAVSTSAPLIIDENGAVFMVVNVVPAAYKGGSLFGFVEWCLPEHADAGIALRLLESRRVLQWGNFNPLATARYGDGFSRELDLIGGWYDLIGNLYRYYDGMTLQAGITEDAADPAPLMFVGTNRYESVYWEPTGVETRVVTNRSGVMTGLVAPRAGTPVKVEGAYNYGETENDVGLTLSLTRNTGIFKGQFKAWFDYGTTHTYKSVAYEGVLTPETGATFDGVAGRGFFLWADKASYLNPQNKPVPYTFNWSYDFLLLGL